MSSTKSRLSTKHKTIKFNFLAGADNKILATYSPDGEEEDEEEMLRRAIAMSLEEKEEFKGELNKKQLIKKQKQ